MFFFFLKLVLLKCFDLDLIWPAALRHDPHSPSVWLSVLDSTPLTLLVPPCFVPPWSLASKSFQAHEYYFFYFYFWITKKFGRSPNPPKFETTTCTISFVTPPVPRTGDLLIKCHSHVMFTLLIRCTSCISKLHLSSL